MWMRNRLWTTQVQAYNETTEEGSGGLVKKGKSALANICVNWLPTRKKYRSLQKGTIDRQIIKVQVSAKELEDKSFSIKVGDTHIIKDNITYRVISELDASFLKTVQLREFEIVRKIPVRVII